MILKHEIKCSEKSSRKIAQELGINPQYLSMIALGKRKPNYERAKQLSNYFNIPINELFPDLQICPNCKIINDALELAIEFFDFDCPDSYEGDYGEIIGCDIDTHKAGDNGNWHVCTGNRVDCWKKYFIKKAEDKKNDY